MSEFLVRGWNVAVPEVDVGDDIFVLRDADGSFSRIQVKSATTRERRYGYSARFRVPLRQLQLPMTPDLTYVFAARRQGRWSAFVVVAREELLDAWEVHGIGASAGESIVLTFQFEAARVICSGVDFTRCLDDFSHWPVVSHGG